MEEFRSIIVDTLTLSLFNLKILQKTDFRSEAPVVSDPSTQKPDDCVPDVTADPMGMITMGNETESTFDLPEQRVDAEPASVSQVTGKYPVRLNPDAFKRVIDAFEKKLTTTFYYAPAERNILSGIALPEGDREGGGCVSAVIAEMISLITYDITDPKRLKKFISPAKTNMESNNF